MFAQLRELIGTDAIVGISGDSLAAASLLAGAPMWFSVIGGLMTAGLPNKGNDPCAR
jgi:hypothetical protein